MAYELDVLQSYVANRRAKRRAFAYAYLGGKCTNCGSDKRLHFDHIDPSTKVTTVTLLMTCKMERLIAELDKCQLLCYDCHEKKTRLNNEWVRNRKPLSHGTSGYIRKCRCEICITEYRIYRKRRWAEARV